MHSFTDSVDVLAVELSNQCVQTFVVGLNTDRGKDGLHVLGSRGGVAANLEEQVCSEMTHLHRHEKRDNLTHETTYCVVLEYTAATNRSVRGLCVSPPRHETERTFNPRWEDLWILSDDMMKV